MTNAYDLLRPNTDVFIEENCLNIPNACKQCIWFDKAILELHFQTQNGASFRILFYLRISIFFSYAAI